MADHRLAESTESLFRNLNGAGDEELGHERRDISDFGSDLVDVAPDKGAGFYFRNPKSEMLNFISPR
jgi:hypothetical protein